MLNALLIAAGAFLLLSGGRSRGSGPSPSPTPQPQPLEGDIPASVYRDAFSRMKRRSYSDSEIERMITVQPTVQYWADLYSVPPELVNAVIHVESRFRPDAESPVGAKGLMQFMPSTWAWYEELLDTSGDPFDPVVNIQFGSYFLRRVTDRYAGDDQQLAKMLASYNWGAGNLNKAVEAHGDNWLAYAPHETQKYVEGVSKAYQDFTDAYARIGAAVA